MGCDLLMCSFKKIASLSIGFLMIFGGCKVFGVSKVSVKYDAELSKINISGNAENYNKDLYNNDVGMCIFKPGKKESDLIKQSMNEVFYGIDETETEQDGTFAFSIPFSGEKGLYKIKISLPNENETIEKTVYCASYEEYNLLLGEINMAKSESELKYIVENNFVMLDLSNQFYEELTIKDSQKSFMTEIINTMFNQKYSTISEFKDIFYKETIIQYIKRTDSLLKVGDAIENNETVLLKDNTKTYLSYLYNKENNKSCVSNLYNRLKMGTFKNHFEFCGFFDEELILSSVEKSEIISKLKKVIDDNLNLLGDNGFKTIEYNQLSSGQQSEVIKAVIGAKYNNMDLLISDLNLKISELLTAIVSHSDTEKKGGGVVMSPSKLNPYIPYEKSNKDQQIPFYDLDNVEWAKNSIEKLYSKGIISGKEEGKFYPDDYITREEFVKIVIISAGLSLSENSKSVFSDVQLTAWYAPYIITAQENNIIQGQGNNRFGIGSNITRQDMAVILYRAFSDKINNNATDNIFYDYNSISDYAKDAVKVLSGNGIINGTDAGYFNPTLFATRAECAKMVCNMLSVINGGEN